MIRAIQEAFFRLVSVLRRRTLDRDFDDEMAAHLDLLTARNERRGLPHDEARRQAILQMGGLNATRHLHREVRGLPRLERVLDELRGFGRDLIHAARSLAKAPAFTFVCVTSLGIGMATVIAIPYFARLMTMSPQGVNADGLVEVLMTPEGPLKLEVGDWARETWSYPDFADLRDADTGMTITGWALGRSRTTVQTSDRVQTLAVPTMFVSANYFRTIGVRLTRGPGFDASVDDALTAVPVVVLGYDFWQNRLGSDPDIIGKTLTLDGSQHVVVGVAPDQYQTHLRDDAGTQLFVPLERHPRLRDTRVRLNRDIPWVRIHGRLSPGVGLAQANATVSATMSRLAELHPASNQFKAASVEPYFSEGARERWEYTILESVLLGLTGIILLIVCLNISGMMQVRVAMRERELSIRQAIGATRARLAAYLLSEAVMLAILGGALGAVVLFGAPWALAWWNDQPLPLAFQEAARPNLPIAVLSVALCLATSLMFGLLPAIRFSRPAVISSLKDDAGGGSRRVGRIHRLTAALQVGIAVPFLVIGGVLVDQVRTTATADLGFEPDGLAALSIDIGGKETQDVDFFLRAVRNNLKQASTVRSVAVADGLPLDFHSRVVRVSRPGESSVVDVHVTRVDEGYLETMEIPLLRGRGITAEDGVGTQLVAVISKPLADRLFGTDNAVGERLTLTPGYSANAAPNRDEAPLAIEGDTLPVFTIVGVAADFVTSQMSAPREQMLVPVAQHPASPVFLVARSETNVPPATSTFQNAVRAVDPNVIPINPTRVADGAQVVTGDQLRQRGMRGYLGEAVVAGGAGGVVLTLAALGIYGVVGFMVASRTREIAVRMALGASRRSVLRMVLSDVVRLVIPGVAGGLLLGILLTPMVASWRVLPGAVIYTVAGAIAVSVALMAGLPPARRAASVEPMVAMRSE